MKIVDSDLRAPGACFICLGNPIPQGGHMIETGARNDYGVINERAGEIYVCSNCAPEIAATAGYVSKDSVADQLSAAEAARADRAKAHELLDEVQSLLNKARPAAAQEA